MNFNKNNLDKSYSPYLQQHKENPIHWQEWSQEVIVYAKKSNKPIFVSVGYSTCHWCHVMAREAFSNNEIASYLNENFVSIKVDREQRPDIDQYLMDFIIKTQGSGGWPLNCILNPDLKPLFAVTYAPITPQYGLPGFLGLLKVIKEGYAKNNKNTVEFSHSRELEQGFEEYALLEEIFSNFDELNAGFGLDVKFAPHNTLLFLLSYFEKTKNKKVKEVIERTLDVIETRGLHDNLQGGFFRYCTDTSWNIPHFEKMLYDQAMLLWVYSAAYKLFKKVEFKLIVEKIIKCLEETFEENNMFYSALDADTDNGEGLTYLWDLKEIQDALSKEEYAQFSKIYWTDKNFEGMIHLLKKENKLLPSVEEKLLKIRKIRPQPFTDKKVITSWNCLVGIGLLMAYRFTGNVSAKEKALNLLNILLKKHYKDKRLVHSSLKGNVQKEEFLEDYSSLLLFVTYAHEETNNYTDLMKELLIKLEYFRRDNDWVESLNTDFMEVPAKVYDHPYPSTVSLAEMAVLRANILLNKEYLSENYKSPLSHDFYNLMAFIQNGNFHLIHVPNTIDWKDLPLNCMQVISKKIQDCYGKSCKEFKNVKELLKNIN